MTTQYKIWKKDDTGVKSSKCTSNLISKKETTQFKNEQKT